MTVTVMVVLVMVLRCFRSQPPAPSAAVTSSTVCLDVVTDRNPPVASIDHTTTATTSSFVLQYCMMRYDDNRLECA